MISTAKTAKKDQLYGRYLTLKKQNPDASTTEIDRLFTLAANYAKDPKVPNFHVGEVLNRIDNELDVVFPPKFQMHRALN
jgi:hypothetical protein